MENKNNSNTVVIIPAYEPPTSFYDYLILLSECGFRKLIVVDDGSGEKYSSVFEKAEKLPSVTLISYSENRGKGHALKTALSYCKTHFNESCVFVTADCDGQHLSGDVVRVAEAAAKQPHTLVLGARDFSLECVPKRSRTGNIFTRRAFSLLYGISLSDTQTGLRAFSYSLLDELLKISGERFEYEMNMLISLHKKDIRIFEEKISTVYAEEADGCERVSHFRTVSDSLRVLGILFRSLGRYFFSSAVSAVIEVSAFFLFTSMMLRLTDLSPAIKMLVPTVSARILSSVFNFILNFKLVFGGEKKGALKRYYLLWTVQLGVSYGIACLLNLAFARLPIEAIEITALITLGKAVCDLIIAVFSYQIQSRWVFARDKKGAPRFYGAYLKFWRVIYNLFVKKYKSSVTPPDSEPCVYVSRHLNTRAPIRICQSIGFDLHFFVLANFFGFRNIYKQYSTYTFTERYKRRGIARILAKIAAFFAALWLAPLIKSIEAIPVHRGGSDSMITFRRAMEYLDRGESLVLFPDIDYTADEGVPSEIYTGFLYLEKMYYRKHRRHLTFVAVSVDKPSKIITETGRVRFESDDFKEELPRVAEKIHSLLIKK